MNIRTTLILGSCLTAAILPSVSHAHFLWISLNPSAHTVSVGLQEVPTQDPLALAARAASVKAALQNGRGIRLKADKNWLNGSTSENCASASLDYGIVDRRDAGRGVFWLQYYAKAATTPGASQAQLNLPVELFAKPARNGQMTITVLTQGKPAKEAEVVIEDKDGKPTFTGKTGDTGTVAVPAPDGPLAVRALVTDPVSGVDNGKPYDLIRAYGTLTINDPAAKPLTQLLRESFGNMHDVISNSLFINDVTTGHLTRQQLDDHLQQRALIHEAVDAILAKGHLSAQAYGANQKQVTQLLRDDMKKMSTPWPAAKAAWPLTADLLNQIHASAQKGPYFALGVFHVYYGGITHGGRDIGEMITHQLKAELTYYQTSTGYEDYARAIDQITDPEAQQQMIQGANAAYKYLIAINNDEKFKP